MNVAEVLQQIDALNIKLSLDGDDLVIRAKKGVVTKDLKEAMVEVKRELVDHLRRETHPPISKNGLGSPPIPHIDVEEVERIEQSLSPDGPIWVVIQSRVLDGEQVIWIRDHDVHVPEIKEGLVKYTRMNYEGLSG